MPKVYVVLVNWNGWQDTIECLESLLRSTNCDFRVVVCDNGSRDDSLARIAAWAEGSKPAPVSVGPLTRFTTPSLSKPIPLVIHDRTKAEQGGAPDDPQLVLIDVAANLGFAGGNNVGLRYALARGDADYAWLLNNDTVVPPQSLSALVERMSGAPDVGICGSVLVQYHAPDRIQALGGARYSPWTTRAYHLGAGEVFPGSVPSDPAFVESQTSYVVGASMLVSRRFLDAVGLMAEDYFLYGEEIDWAARAKGLFTMGFAPASVVYHKVGGSTPKATAKDAWALELLYANKLKATRRFFRPYLWINYCWYCIEVAKASARRDWIRARSVFRALTRRNESTSSTR